MPLFATGVAANIMDSMMAGGELSHSGLAKFYAELAGLEERGMDMDVRALLEETYRAALAAVSPGVLLEGHLNGKRPDFILAFGKAALPMARAALRAYPENAKLGP